MYKNHRIIITSDISETVNKSTAALIRKVIRTGLAAEGTTFVEHIHFVERGYESLVRKFTTLGADIRRIED